MSGKAHWENIYATKTVDNVSWYQAHPSESLGLIQRTGIDRSARIIDVGGGASTLVDHLLVEGFDQITVLDIASTALERARIRLGEHAADVTWVEADITQTTLPDSYYDLWHDRAVFHFLTNADDKQRYVAAVKRSLKKGGHIIVASFAPDGPSQCSGLDVVRYSPTGLQHEIGD